MHQKWQQWSKTFRKWLWVLVIIGIVAALPVAADRWKTESTSNNVEFVFNYRSLVEIASYQANPEDYIAEQLKRLQDAGVGSMAVYDSTLDELRRARRIMLFNSSELANQTQGVIPANENYTYVLFTSTENAERLSPIIEEAFTSLDIPVKPWSFRGQSGLILETPQENATLKQMHPDPIAFEMLYEKGFTIVPRMGDSVPYNQEQMDERLAYYAAHGVKRLLFDGEAVKGFNDNEEMKSLSNFAELLNKYNIGLTAIENIKKPQLGFSKLAYLTNYNVVRLYSLSDADANLSPDTIADRFALATKDRNIRMLYLNASASRNPAKAMITTPIDNLITSLTEPGNAIEKIESNGFTIGTAEAFQVAESSWQRYFKMGAVVGAVAMIALLVSYFVPVLTIPAFLLGLLGGGGLYLLRPLLFEQALALMVSISAPTIAMILAIRKLNYADKMGTQLTASRRLVQATILYIVTAIISFTAVPFINALLNNVTYQLVIDQFRGVSLLYATPIALTAVYVLFYRGGRIFEQIWKLMRTPITMLWILAAVVVGVVGLYYMSRTGNSGSVTPIEMVLRTFLENNFGVRPRNKEFLMAHPIFLLGIFLAFKYRSAVYLMIIASIGQLSMVGTFAHLHTPIYLSIIRGLLGLGLGFIVGLIAIVAWQILEGCWKRWLPLLRK